MWKVGSSPGLLFFPRVDVTCVGFGTCDWRDHGAEPTVAMGLSVEVEPGKFWLGK